VPTEEELVATGADIEDVVEVVSVATLLEDLVL